MTGFPLDSIECCTFCTEVLRPTHLFLLYSRCAVLYDYHPALTFVIPGFACVSFCPIHAHEEHGIFWFVRTSVHLSVLYSNHRVDN